MHASHYKRLDTEIAMTPMPAEYADTTVKILCNDCHQKCVTKWHVLGLRSNSNTLRWFAFGFASVCNKSQMVGMKFEKS